MIAPPMVSVVVPVYNVDRYLSQCIESVLRQSLSEFELILIDDGSTDRSPGICDHYASQDARVRVVHQTNRGLSGARNVGLDLVVGEFVTFLDADDWLDDDTLASAIEAADRTGADVVLWPYVREYEGLSLPKPLFDFEERTFGAEETRSLLCRRMVGLLGRELETPEQADALVTACCKLYRRSLLDARGVRFVATDIVGTEDALYNLQVFTHATSAVYVNRALYHYRRDNVSSVTTRYKASLPKDWDELHRRMLAQIQEKSLGAEFEQALRNRVALSIIGLGLNALNAPSRKEGTKVIRDVLTAEGFRTAISSLEFHHLPPHWRFFFTTVRWGNVTLVHGLLQTMDRLRRWRNRASR